MIEYTRATVVRRATFYWTLCGFTGSLIYRSLLRALGKLTPSNEICTLSAVNVRNAPTIGEQVSERSSRTTGKGTASSDRGPAIAETTTAVVTIVREHSQSMEEEDLEGGGEVI